MEILKKIGRILAVLLAAGEMIGQILGFLLIPALIVICGVLNSYTAEYYWYALGIYLVMYLVLRLILGKFEKWLERKMKKKGQSKK